MLSTEVAACRLRSTEKDSLIPADINFVNRSAKPAAIYWLDYAGNASFQLWLRAGGSKEHHSFVGQHWCVVDPDRAEAAQSFIITEPEQTITIR